MSLLDARGVEISPGDTVIYGFSVSRSVAMAEGVVLGEPESEFASTSKVSLTPTGLVRIWVVRRSYASGLKSVVNLMPDRMVVLKRVNVIRDHSLTTLPLSPLPTQDEEHRAELERLIASYTENIRANKVPDYWMRGEMCSTASLADYLAYCGRKLESLRQKLRNLDG